MAQARPQLPGKRKRPLPGKAADQAQAEKTMPAGAQPGTVAGLRKRLKTKAAAARS